MQTLFYHLFHSKWDDDLQNEHLTVLKPRELFTEVKKI